MKATFASVLVLSAVVLGMASGCATVPPENRPVRQAAYRAPDFLGATKGTVVMLPVVDARRDGSVAVDVQDRIGRPILSALKGKGYNVVSASDAGGTAAPLRDVGEMSVDELCALGPADAQVVLLVSVDDMTSRYTVIGYTFKAQLSGIIVDKSRRQILWKDRAIGDGGQGGLISGLMAPAIKSLSITTAINALVQSVPWQVAQGGHAPAVASR